MDGISGVGSNSQAMSVSQANSQFMDSHEVMKAELNAAEVNAKVFTKNKETLEQEDFLKLLMKELEYQDPLEPMDNKEFIGQMAQFSNLHQTSEVVNQLKNLSGMTSDYQTFQLLGKEVKYVDPQDMYMQNGDSKYKSGTVNSLVYDSMGRMVVEIDNKEIDPMNIIMVGNASDDKE